MYYTSVIFSSAFLSLSDKTAKFYYYQSIYALLILLLLLSNQIFILLLCLASSQLFCFINLLVVLVLMCFFPLSLMDLGFSSTRKMRLLLIAIPRKHHLLHGPRASLNKIVMYTFVSVSAPPSDVSQFF